MPTHLYCLVPARIELTLPPAIRALVVDDIVGWVSTTESPALSRDARDVARATIEHDRVIGAALSQGTTPLPASLADPYPDDVAARDDLGRHSQAIADALAGLQGLVEMTTLVALTESPPVAGEGRGRAYMEQLRTRPARAGAIADKIALALTPLAGAGRQRGEDGRLALSHLIRRDVIEQYRSLALSQPGEGYRIVVDGPRAPYSFGRFSPGRGVIEHLEQ